MKSRRSILIAVILSILPILSCTNPIIEEFFARDKGQNKPPNDPEIITVSGVSLNTNELELTIDGSTTLTASVRPENATNRTVTWSSSDESIVAVDDGLVTALAEGTATITVTAVDGEHTASCEVTVEAVAPDTVAVTGVSLNTTGLTLPVGETETLIAEIEPGNATNQTVNWTSTNTDVATVDAVSGVVTALGEGTATITVTTVNGGKTASCEVTVFVAVTGISLNLSTLTLPVGDAEPLLVTVQPENATNKSVTWASSDDLVATVNSGIITSLAAGDATITVTTVDGNHTASCTITVKERTGEAEAPFLIKNELELRQVGTGIDGWNLSAHYKLAVDITLTQGDWTTIGDNSSGDNLTRFTGSFNGNNKTITGLSFNKPNMDFQGMFGFIGTDGEVKNLTLADCDISGKDYVGGVAGLNQGTVLDSHVTGNVSGNSRIGGVAGRNESTITNCGIEGNVSGIGPNVGGVTGINFGNATVENCYAKGDVSGSIQVGGVAGVNYDITCIVKNCYVTGMVIGTEFVGGVMGLNQGTVIDSRFTGNVSGDSRVGGVVGGNNPGTTAENCYATGNVSGRLYVGGVVGISYNNATVKNCYAAVDVSGTGNGIGGVAGSNISGTVESCYSTGDVSGSGNVGGVAGSNNSGTVMNCYATGNVSGSSRVGGVAGYNSGTVESSYATGNVNGTGNTVGGVVGHGYTASIIGGVVGYNSGTVESSYATGNVNGTGNTVGGVVGYGYTASITRNCYATGNVSGTEDVGGVMGYRYGGTVGNCYATGNVSGTENVGGVVGRSSGSTNCVALNPNINSTGTSYGRIGNSGINYARRDMKHNNSEGKWTNNISGSGWGGLDGVDITPANYQNQSWWSSHAGFDFSATGAWAWDTAGKLPILKDLGTQNPKVSAYATPESTIVVNGTAFEMVWINAVYVFRMGSPTGELNRESGETQHPVELKSGFYMGKYEVTQAQYEMVTGTTITAQQALAGDSPNDNHGQGNNYPMYYVSWNDALVFCNKLSMLEGLSPAYSLGGVTDPAEWGEVPRGSDVTWNDMQIVSGSTGYRLPTEAQWEYACRAGTTEAYNWGTDNVNTTQANFNNIPGRTSVVGSYAPNAWGLYDMVGNVEEWCWDRYDPVFRGWADTIVTDPTGPSEGNLRIFRGGNWSAAGQYLRSAARNGTFPGFRHDGKGFRIIRPF